MLKLLMKLYSKTIAKIDFPFSHKKFKLQDYFKLEEELNKLEVPFAVGIVTTYGSGSNLGIRLSNLISKNKDKKKSRKTHAFIFINNYDGRKFRVAEQVGTGLQEVSLLEAIGQRDEVTIRVPNKKFIADTTSNVAREYILDLLKQDEIENIPYDNTHALLMDNTSDCSGLVWQSLSYAFKELGQDNLLETIDRAGLETYTPVDAEFSKLFNTIYDSKKGFIK